MPFIPKSHQKSKRQRPEKSPQEVRDTIAQIREMCDRVEHELGGGGADPGGFDMREAKPVPTSLGLCPDDLRHIIDTNMAHPPPSPPEHPPALVETPLAAPPPATPSIYDDVFA